jgi:hypothetical protein
LVNSNLLLLRRNKMIIDRKVSKVHYLPEFSVKKQKRRQVWTDTTYRF